MAVVSSGSCLKLYLCSSLDIRLFSTKLSCQLFWGRKQEMLFDYNFRAPLKPSINSVYDFPNIQGIKFVLFLCFSISHMQEHTIEHRFQWCLNPKYNCVKSKLWCWISFTFPTTMPHICNWKTNSSEHFERYL